MEDTEFMTAAEKERVLKQWRTFLKGGCQYKHFTNRLYDHLIQHCEFIAHYNRDGFYRTYFADRPEMTARFLSQFDRKQGTTPISYEYGLTYWCDSSSDYADINQAMIDTATEYIPSLIQDASTRQREQDISTAKTLLARHGITVET